MDINLFDIVQSHDFPDRPEGMAFATEGERACFAEGVVVAVIEVGEEFTFTDGEGVERTASFPDCARFAVRVTRRVFSGRVLTGPRVEAFVFPPVNGIAKLFGGVTNGVVKVAA
jgi:hypothetical protein